MPDRCEDVPTPVELKLNSPGFFLICSVSSWMSLILRCSGATTSTLGTSAISATAIRSVSGSKASLVNVGRSEEHTSELQSLMRISYAVLCLNKTSKYIKNLRAHTICKTNNHNTIVVNETSY